MKTGISLARSLVLARLKLAVLPLSCVTIFPTAAQNVTQMPVTIVTANRFEQDVQSAPVAVSILTGAQILASGATDANDAIRKLLGIASRTDLTGGRDYLLDLRGFGASADQNVVVIVDGIRISENEAATARLSAIAPEMIESIEVVRGGSSVQWGEGASAGLINVVLKQSTAKGVTGSLTGQLESYAGRDARANIQVGGDSVGFDANIRSYATNAYRDNNAARQDTASVGLNLNAGAVKLRLRVATEDQNSRFPGALTLAQFQANPQQSTTPDDFGKFAETRLSAGAQYRKGATTFALDMGSRNRDASSNYANFGFTGQTKSSSYQVSPKISHTGTLTGSAMTLVAGADFNRWNYAATSSFSQNEAAYQFNEAFYLSGDLYFKSGTRLAGGVRQERINKRADDAANFVSYDRSDRLDAWDLGLNHALTSGFNLYARTAKAYRLPNVDENRFLTAALRSQTTRDLEAGIKWRNQADRSASLRVFEQNAIDEIAFNPLDPACAPFGCNANLDPTRRSGVELEGRVPLSKSLALSGSIQTVHARFTEGSNAGREIPLVSSVSGAVRLNWAIDARQSLNMGVQYLGSARLGNDNDNSCTARIPARSLLDARYSWRLNRIELSLAANNLTDEKSYSNAFSCTTGSLYPDPGRTLRAAIKYAF